MNAATIEKTNNNLIQIRYSAPSPDPI